MTATNGFDARLLKYYVPRDKFRNQQAQFRYLDPILTADNFRKIFVGRFRWKTKNAPSGYIENIIFSDGVAFYHKHPVAGDLFCAGSVKSWNIHGKPIRFLLNTPDGASFETDDTTTVPIYDVPTFFIGNAGFTFASPAMLGLRYSELVSELIGTAVVYSKGLKKPTIIPTTDKDAASNRIITNKVLDDEPFIFVAPRTKENTLDDMTTVFHNTTHNASDLNGILTARKTLFSECLQRLGVKATLLEKAAYQSDTENDREDLSADLVLALCKETREKAVEEIVKLGGVVSVVLCDELKPQAQESENVDSNSGKSGED